jgi:hypothetical protein
MYKHPEFIDYAKSNNISYQTYYELYDIYGEDESIWKKYTSKNITDNINLKGILDTVKNINLDSLEENISSIQKAVLLIEELTKSETKKEKENPKEEKITNLYGEE